MTKQTQIRAYSPDLAIVSGLLRRKPCLSADSSQGQKSYRIIEIVQQRL